jgi:hypothetical protein
MTASAHDGLCEISFESTDPPTGKHPGRSATVNDPECLTHLYKARYRLGHHFSQWLEATVIIVTLDRTMLTLPNSQDPYRESSTHDASRHESSRSPTALPSSHPEILSAERTATFSLSVREIDSHVNYKATNAGVLD